jgi:hypothetical protein
MDMVPEQVGDLLPAGRHLCDDSMLRIPEVQLASVASALIRPMQGEGVEVEWVVESSMPPV